MTHLVLELLQQKPSQRASAAQALDLLPCVHHQQQQQQRQVGAEDNNSTNETVQQYAQQNQLQQDQSHPADSSSDHACSSVDEDGVHTECNSSADSPAHLAQEEQPAGRRPWWGTPLCWQVALCFGFCLTAIYRDIRFRHSCNLESFLLLLSWSDVPLGHAAHSLPG